MNSKPARTVLNVLIALVITPLAASLAQTTYHVERPDDAYLPGTPPAKKPIVSPGGWQVLDGFVSIQVNVDANGNNILDDAANEPSIAVDRTNPDRIVIGWRQFDTIASSFRQAGYAYSHDGGRTWTFPGVLEPGVFRSDPVLDADGDGNIYYYSLASYLGYTCQMFITSDQGLTWLGPISAFGGDKAWIAIDRTDGIGRGNIYCAWDHYGCCGRNIFTRSLDGGLSYSEPMTIPGFPIWGTVTVDPDGNVYVAGTTTTSLSRFFVVKSTNAQDPGVAPTFENPTLIGFDGALRGASGGGPNPGGLLGQVWIAADHSGGPTDGNLYALASVVPFGGGDPLEVRLIRSTDGGQTWSAPLRVNDDPVGNNAWQWFGTLAVAPSGRIDAIWNDTRNGGGNYRLSELFYAYSTDAGDTWSPNIPVSPQFNSYLGWPQQNKLGDYYDMISDELGAKIAYAATFNGEQDVYFLRLAIDCNNNGFHDGDDIASGRSPDINNNGVPDECECVGDLNGDGFTDLADLGILLADFGCLPPGPCVGDLDGDGDTDLADLGILLADFGCGAP